MRARLIGLDGETVTEFTVVPEHGGFPPDRVYTHTHSIRAAGLDPEWIGPLSPPQVEWVITFFVGPLDGGPLAIYKRADRPLIR